MLRLSKNDLTYGDGTKTGLPKPLVGGLKLNTKTMPVGAAGRVGKTNAKLSYALVRGCVKLLDGELSAIELIGSDSTPSAIHLILANGKSQAWIGHEQMDSGKALFLRGMPFSSQLVNYNTGLAIGLYLMLNREHYPSFAKAVGEAVTGRIDPKQSAYTLALMADEMSHTVEHMIDGTDPLGVQAIILDRAAPIGLETVHPGGDAIREAFTSAIGFRNLVGEAAVTTELLTSTEQTFLGDLPVKLKDCILRGKHVLLTGPTATGKTLAVEEACLAMGAPLTVIRGSEGLEDRDLIAAVSLENGNTVTKYGPIPEAMLLGKRQYELYLQEIKNAKREKREPLAIPPAILLIDEINRLQLRFQNFLVSCMNVRKATQDYYLRIPDSNEEITCPDGFVVIIAARNLGSAFLGTNPMDLALERRFYKKIDLQYLPQEQEASLLQSRTGLNEKLTQVLCKVAADTRFQLSQLKAPLDTGTLLAWAEELAWLQMNGSNINEQVILECARDVIFDIVIERSERGGFDQAGEAVLTDNISESLSNPCSWFSECIILAEDSVYRGIHCMGLLHIIRYPP